MFECVGTTDSLGMTGWTSTLLLWKDKQEAEAKRRIYMRREDKSDT